MNYTTPEEFMDKMNLSLPDEAQGLDVIERCISDTMAFSVRTGNPLFFDKLYAGSEPIGQVLF